MKIIIGVLFALTLVGSIGGIITGYMLRGILGAVWPVNVLMWRGIALVTYLFFGRAK